MLRWLLWDLRHFRNSRYSTKVRICYSDSLCIPIPRILQIDLYCTLYTTVLWLVHSFGLFCHQDLSKIAQSGHTGSVQQTLTRQKLKLKSCLKYSLLMILKFKVLQMQDSNNLKWFVSNTIILFAIFKLFGPSIFNFHICSSWMMELCN